jgi:hypothetical protein
MSKLPILKSHVTEVGSDTDKFKVFPVKELNQQNVAIFTLKALICLLIALMTLYLFIVLRFYTFPKFYQHNCTSTVHDLNTSDKNELHIIATSLLYHH